MDICILYVRININITINTTNLYVDAGIDIGVCLVVDMCMYVDIGIEHRDRP